MTIIDANWIKARLTKRGQQSELARHIGLSPQKMSAVVNGDRRLTQEEAQAIAHWFGETITPTSEPTGFAEPMAEPYAPRPESPEEGVLAIAARQGHHAQYHRITRDAPALALRANDLVIIEMRNQAKPGDLVLCSIRDADTGEDITQVRRWFEPWLIEGEIATRADPADGTVAVRGPVIGVLRGTLFTK